MCCIKINWLSMLHPNTDSVQKHTAFSMQSRMRPDKDVLQTGLMARRVHWTNCAWHRHAVDWDSTSLQSTAQEHTSACIKRHTANSAVVHQRNTTKCMLPMTRWHDIRMRDWDDSADLNVERDLHIATFLWLHHTQAVCSLWHVIVGLLLNVFSNVDRYMMQITYSKSRRKKEYISPTIQNTWHQERKHMTNINQTCRQLTGTPNSNFLNLSTMMTQTCHMLTVTPDSLLRVSGSLLKGCFA